MSIKAISSQIQRYLDSGQPVIHLMSSDEAQAERFLRALAEDYFDRIGAKPFYATWNSVDGLVDHSGEQARDIRQTPDGVMKYIRSSRKPGFFVLKDVEQFLFRPEIGRAMKNIHYELRGTEQFVFLLSATYRIPPELTQHVPTVELPPPEADEIREMIDEFSKKTGRLLGKETVSRMTIGLRGLDLQTIESIFRRFTRMGAEIPEAQYLEEIYAEKQQAVRKTGLLEFVPPRWTLDSIGGLGNLKAWLLQRKPFFSDLQLLKSMPHAPRGVLMVGIPGCGKSLAVKASSSILEIPLYRMDPTNIFGQSSPEAAFNRALRLVEEIAPCILWNDEIEKLLLNSGDDDGMGAGTSSNNRVLGTFLSWMEEKSALVFSAATANRIAALPAELIRKGRFDQVFFVDLPNPAERQEVFAVHLAAHSLPMNEFDLAQLAEYTPQWSGAEIQESVASALILAHTQRKPLTHELLLNQIKVSVPLAKSMAEQIVWIRDWAFDRATPAGRFSTVRQKAS